MGIINIIKSCPLFYEFYDDELERIVEKCEIRHFKPGEFIYRQGDDANEIIIIIEGSVQIEKNNITLKNIGKGDMLGELVLLNRSKQSVDLKAIEETNLLILNHNFIHQLFEDDSKIFALFFVNLSRILGRRLVQAGGQIKDLNRKIEELIINQKSKAA